MARPGGRASPRGDGRPSQPTSGSGLLPFDHERQLASVVVRRPDGDDTLVTKGAPEAVLARCSTSARGGSRTLERLFGDGARVVAVATRAATGSRQPTPADERDLQLVGFLTFVDRPEAGRRRVDRQAATRSASP